MIYTAFDFFRVVQLQVMAKSKIMRLPASFQTIIPSTLVPHWAEVTCSVPRPPQTFPELHIAASIEARQ